MENVVTREVAERELNGWLEFRRVSDRRRENFEEQVETLIDAICSGIVTITSDNEILMKLQYPSDLCKELKFKSRLTVRDLRTRLANVKASDGDARIEAYLIALTGTTQGAIGLMDTADYSLASSVVVFFL